MKKTLALVLALVMVLCAVSAMAEGSKTVDDTQKTTVTNGYTNAPAEAELPTMEIVTPSAAAQAVIDQFKTAHDAGDILSALPDDVKAQLGEEEVNINEMIAVKFSGDTNVTDAVEVTLSFMTKYNAGDEVSVLVGKLDGENVKWTVMKGKINEDGEVVLIVPAEMVKDFENDEFLVAVVSK